MHFMTSHVLEDHSIPDHDPPPVDFRQPSSLTIEGMVGGLGGMSHATGWRRPVAIGIAVMVIGPFVAMIVAAVALGIGMLLR
jgi:hypothetical protein